MNIYCDYRFRRFFEGGSEKNIFINSDDIFKFKHSQSCDIFCLFLGDILKCDKIETLVNLTNVIEQLRNDSFVIILGIGTTIKDYNFIFYQHKERDKAILNFFNSISQKKYYIGVRNKVCMSFLVDYLKISLNIDLIYEANLNKNENLNLINTFLKKIKHICNSELNIFSDVVYFLNQTFSNDVNLSYDCTTNYLSVEEGVKITGKIKGFCNRIVIEKIQRGCNINLNINGSHNLIYIKSSTYNIGFLKLNIGNIIEANNCIFIIGNNFCCVSLECFLYTPANKLFIDDNCLFSRGIIIRLGEIPHLIFDKNAKYLDDTDGIYIGKHCWVGEYSYFNKRSFIPHDCIIGSRSVVTKKFFHPYSVIAGNPAKEVKNDIRWFINVNSLGINNDFFDNFTKFYNMKNFYSKEDDFDNISLDNLIILLRRYFIQESN